MVRRNCSEAGYRPFSAASSITFWAKTNSTANASEVPPLTLILGQSEGEKYCKEKLKLQELHAVETGGSGWSKYDVPIGSFKCEGYITPGDATILTFENGGGAELAFCLDEVRIGSGSSSQAAAAG